MTNSGDILLPTAYFPPITYFIHTLRGRNIFIEQMEPFPKQTYRNRCEIMTSAGKASLIVPVSRPRGNHTMTKDIEICYREPWQQHHWKALQSAYRSSPYFSYYSDILEPYFNTREISLLAHNQNILEMIFKLTGIACSVEFTGNFVKNPEDTTDLRRELSPKKDRSVIDHPVYPQVFSHKFGFMPGLSILDLLFNMGPEAGAYLEAL
jgi:hypothetical protein